MMLGSSKRYSLLCVCACLMLVDHSAAQPEGPVTLQNSQVRLTVNPSVGRIVDFGRVDGPNLMRITNRSVLTDAKRDIRGYQGYGGDQLWPAQQAKWGTIRGAGGTWPPLDELDGPNWTIRDQGPRHVTIEAPQTPLLGLQVERRIELGEDDARVTITNRFSRAEDKPHEVLIWSVTGLVEPEYTMMGISPDRPDDSRLWTNLVGRPDSIIRSVNNDRSIRFDVQSHGPGQALGSDATKIGTHGDWLAAIYQDDILLQRSTYQVGGSFPDDASLEIYSSQNSGSEYIELEVLSTEVDLPLGQSLSSTVHWHLLDRPRDLNDDQMAAFLESVPEPTTCIPRILSALGTLHLLRRRRVPGS